MHYTTKSYSLFAGEQISRAFLFRGSAGKKEKTRGSLTGAEKDDLRRMERKLEKRLTTGYRASDASARERPRGGEGWGAGVTWDRPEVEGPATRQCLISRFLSGTVPTRSRGRFFLSVLFLIYLVLWVEPFQVLDCSIAGERFGPWLRKMG